MRAFDSQVARGSASGLEQRIERLEREARRWRRMALALLAVAAAALLMAQAVPRVVQAERFEVVDEQGNLRIVLGLASPDRAVLAFNESDGDVQIVHAVRWQTAAQQSDTQGEADQPSTGRAEQALRNFGRNLSDAVDSAGRSLNRERGEDQGTPPDTE